MEAVRAGRVARPVAGVLPVTLTIAILGLVRHGGRAGPDLDRAALRRFRRLRRQLRRELADMDRVCVCTCVRKAHRHFRAGSDCGNCGKAACRAFRPARRRFKIIFRRRPS